MSRWSVIGSRCLPKSWESRVGEVVDLLLSRGHRICSGGAVGADLAALRSLVRHGASACKVSSVFLPGDLSLSPPSCLPWLSRFAALGGEIVEGSALEGSSRQEVVAALLIRNCALVRASVGVVAFVSGCSAGSWFTIAQAIRRDLDVVVFPVDGPSGLHNFVRGSWVPCRSLVGAYVFTYFEKE